jgi:hypothetical protein
MPQMDEKPVQKDLPVAEPLLKFAMPATSPRGYLFWLVFAGVSVPTLFLPVFPVEPYRIEYVYWARPLEAYIFVFVFPIVAFPIAATHFATCFQLSKLISDRNRTSTSFSLMVLFKLVTFISFVLAVVAAFRGTGFVVLFYITSIVVAVANLRSWNSIFGLPYLQLGPFWSKALLWSCSSLALLGLISIFSSLSL